MSKLFTTSFIIHRTTKSSRTLERQAVREIGRVSPSQVGCDTFGIGEVHESFQAVGIVPEVRDVLKIVATGSIIGVVSGAGRNAGSTEQSSGGISALTDV
jgi:hypothetical protein